MYFGSGTPHHLVMFNVQQWTPIFFSAFVFTAGNVAALNLVSRQAQGFDTASRARILAQNIGLASLVVLYLALLLVRVCSALKAAVRRQLTAPPLTARLILRQQESQQRLRGRSRNDARLRAGLSSCCSRSAHRTHLWRQDARFAARDGCTAGTGRKGSALVHRWRPRHCRLLLPGLLHCGGGILALCIAAAQA